MSELARSMVAVSSEARYMRVVASDECPIPSLITLIATPFRYATEAQLWRATYIVRCSGRCIRPAIVWRRALMREAVRRYEAYTEVLPGETRGSRKGLSDAGYCRQ